jgi:hypothetical protein
MPPAPPWSIREADTSAPLAPITATAPRIAISSALSIARSMRARASGSGRSVVCEIGPDTSPR